MPNENDGNLMNYMGLLKKEISRFKIESQKGIYAMHIKILEDQGHTNAANYLKSELKKL